MYKKISDTAEFGGLKQGKRIVPEIIKMEMKKILNEIQNKKFFMEWELDSKNGYEKLNKLRNEQKNILIEETTKLINSSSVCKYK